MYSESVVILMPCHVLNVLISEQFLSLLKITFHMIILLKNAAVRVLGMIQGIYLHVCFCLYLKA